MDAATALPAPGTEAAADAGRLAATLNRFDRCKVPARDLRRGDTVVLRSPRTGCHVAATVEVSRVADPHAIRPVWWLLHLREGDGSVLAFTCAPGNTACYRTLAG